MKKRRLNTINRNEPRHKVLFYTILILSCIFAIFPAYWLLMTALTKRGALLQNNGLFPGFENMTFDAFIRIFKERPMATWIWNSILIALGTVALVLVIATMAGYSLSRFRFRSNRTIGYVLLLACMLPPTLIIIPLYITFSKMNLLNSALAVVLANSAITVPFSTWMMKGFFDGIPVSLEEAAQIDGCNVFSAIMKIVLPLCKPGLITTVIYVAVLSWSDFLFARTFLVDQTQWTMTIGVYTMIGEHLILWEEICAVALLSIIPITIIFTVFQRHLISGMAVGAVKQ